MVTVVPVSVAPMAGALIATAVPTVAGVLPVPRFDGVIVVMDPTNTVPVATWTFARGLPAKVVGPALNAKTGDVAIEELHIAHEGLRLETR